MTKATVCLATAFCALLAIECSSSSSNNGPSKDAAPPSFADVNGSALAAPSPGICGNCVKPQVCCVGFLSMTGQCQDMSASCAGAVAECMAPTDCMGSQVCCGKGGRGGTGFSLACADSCTASGTGGIAFQLCDSNHPCPTGSMCTAPPGAPGGGGRGGGDAGSAMICFNPAMFRPPMDAGAAETGPAEAGPAETGSSDANSSPDTTSATDAGAGG